MTDPTRTPGQTADAALDRAEAWGTDLWLLRESLRLTPAERLARHQRALDLVASLRPAAPPRPLMPPSLLDRLTEAGAEVVIVGGVAAVLHGANYTTVDLDVCYATTGANRRRLVAALRPLDPYPRVEPGLPFAWDQKTLRDTPFLTLTTAAGPLDLIPEVPGVGTYEAVRARSVGGGAVRVLSLDALIDAKRATDRPKDRALLVELEALRALR